MGEKEDTFSVICIPDEIDNVKAVISCVLDDDKEGVCKTVFDEAVVSVRLG